MADVICSQCGEPIDEDLDGPGGDRSPCPNCGGMARAHEIVGSIRIGLSAKAGFRMKQHRTEPSGRKWKSESINECQHSYRFGREVHVLRIIDRKSRWYTERITDPKTGEVLHEVSEPLVEHRDHGSAKKRK